jgi:hypothetical protein
MKGVPFRVVMVNHPELKFPPLAKAWWLVRRIYWPEGEILVRYRPLGVTGFREVTVIFGNPGATRQNTGISPRLIDICNKYRVLYVRRIR